jgi:thymidylate synthase
MGVEITAKTGREAYYEAVQRTLNGKLRAPRNVQTRDAGFTTILVESPYDALPLGVGRAPLLAIGAAEAMQLIGGLADPGIMFRISPKFLQYADDGRSFHGAYGARIKMQVVHACNKLRDDVSTRQAIVTLWDEYLDNLHGHADYPCTVALQFQMDEGKLCMNTVMRSNDVYLGLPYDLFQFTQLQLTVARSLGREPGWYRHTTMSLHAYERDVERLTDIRPAMPVATADPGFQPKGVGLNGQTFTQIMMRARRILTGLHIADLTDDEQWFVDKLDPFVTHGEV